MNIILASQSPRRQQMLAYLVDDFTIAAADIDETPLADESPRDYVLRLAVEKAQTIAKTNPQAFVIGSDTTVVFDNHILGKPVDLADCKAMLMMLSGQRHQVMTAFAVVNQGKVISEIVVTEVDFCHLTEQEIEQYWQTGEPQDKAGSYAIQGIGSKFVKQVNGSVSSVVGLPLAELNQVLKEFL